MSNETLTNIPVVSVERMKDLLSTIYVNSLNAGTPLKLLPSVMLWGSMGVGKSQGVRELASDIALKTGKTVKVTDHRLLLDNPVDLKGIPTASADKTAAIWLRPKIFDMDPSNDVVNILFLDEISAAPVSVQAAAYQITLDRCVGEHKLPENCIVIAAGNKVTDKSVSYQMPRALANRLLHMEIVSDYDAWHKWAVEHNIHPYVRGFLRFKPDRLNTFDPKDSTLAFATGRSWEMVSNLLYNVNGDIKLISDLISGVIGVGTCHELMTWSRVYSKLPNIEGIFQGSETELPKTPDVLYALTSSLVTFAIKYKDNMKYIENSIKYINKMPADYSLIVIKDYMYIEPNYKNKLLRIPEFKKWLDTKGRLLNVN